MTDGRGTAEAMEADGGGTQLTTDKLAPAILVMQQHILLLKYRHGELHLGGRRGPDFLNGGRPPDPPLEPSLDTAIAVCLKACPAKSTSDT